MLRVTLYSSLLALLAVASSGCQKSSTVADVPPARDNDPITARADPTLTNTNATARGDDLFNPAAANANNTQPTDVFTLGDPGNPTTPAAGRTYTIQRGDTLWSIAANQYGNGQKWRDIVNANPSLVPERLAVGQTIRLP